MTTVRVGTSGWHYPTGEGTWNGLFYPARPRRTGPGAFDELRYYAEHFDTVEVNSTFYGQPRAEVTRAWAVEAVGGDDAGMGRWGRGDGVAGMGLPAVSCACGGISQL